MAGNSLAVQRLGLQAFTLEGVGLIPGPGTRIPRFEAQPYEKVERVIADLGVLTWKNL